MFNHHHKTHGFTLIEALVAAAILATGLLGLAGLQISNLKSTQTAYTRSQATQLAYDLADRMRANTLGAAIYTTITPDLAKAQANCATATGCTVANMAENDLYEWNQSLINSLPSGLGSISSPSANLYLITISWDENKDGNSDTSFQTTFKL